MRVALVGAAGYVGGELLRLVLQHPEVTHCVATSRSQAGKPIGAVHPALALLSEERFSGASAGEAADTGWTWMVIEPWRRLFGMPTFSVIW